MRGLFAVARDQAARIIFSSFGPMPGSAESGANSGLRTGGRIARSCSRHSRGATRWTSPGIHNHDPSNMDSGPALRAVPE